MTKDTPHLLLVEDDLDTAELILEVLADNSGISSAIHVDHVAQAMDAQLEDFDIVLSDINLPDGSGLELISMLLEKRSDIPIVMITSEGDLDTAMDAIRRGAYDYVVKIGDYLNTIPLVVKKNLEVWRLKQDNVRLQGELEQTLEEVSVKNQQLEGLVGKLENLASTDPLTGLANRRHIQSVLEHSFAEATRYGTDLGCMMIDLDGFKPLNDTLGHQMGDRMLQSTARVLNANCRRSDVAGRYGGDEFVVLFPHTGPEFVDQVANRIQQEFASVTSSLLPENIPCQMSIGLACISIANPGNADQLVARADAALYHAKEAGKGRIALCDPSSGGYVMSGKTNQLVESDTVL